MCRIRIYGSSVPEEGIRANIKPLSSSPIEKARHRAILNNPKLPLDVWWSLVLEFWHQDRAAFSSPNSSHDASGAPTSERPQALRGSNAAAATSEGHGGANQRYAPTSSPRPVPVVRDHANDFFDQLNYLDLAAQCSPTTKRRREKWDSILGC